MGRVTDVEKSVTIAITSDEILEGVTRESLTDCTEKGV